MAILKTRKHNDNPDWIVIELYDDQGNYVNDSFCDANIKDMTQSVKQLLSSTNCHINVDYHEPEKLI